MCVFSTVVIMTIVVGYASLQISDYFNSVGVIITSTGWDERLEYESLQHQLDLNFETVRLTEGELDADSEETSAAIENAPF